jgi:hypothetical protein
MIEESSDMDGNFQEGSICCDNKSCKKVLYEWDDVQDAPDNDRSGYYAYAVKTRFLFSRYPTNLALSALQLSRAFSVKDGVQGYIFDLDVLPLRLDFCSIECCLAWLNDDTNSGIGRDGSPLKDKMDYGVILYGENPQEQNQLTADNPTRFETLPIGNFLATTAPKNQFHLPIGHRIKIAGKSYDVRNSTILRKGEKEPAIGIGMTMLMIKCPMKLDSSSQTCNQLIQVLVDFLPSVWICPICNGIIIIYKASNSMKNSRANWKTNLKTNLGKGKLDINFDYYFGPHDWGNKKFVHWITKEIGADIIAVADPYEDNGMLSNLIANTFVDLDNVVSLFEHLIS